MQENRIDSAHRKKRKKKKKQGYAVENFAQGNSTYDTEDIE